jgi:hypothetical protein
MIQKSLGFSIEQRVHTGVATINPKEKTMTTTNTTFATQNEAFMWSELLCGVRDSSVAATACSRSRHSA